MILKFDKTVKQFPITFLFQIVGFKGFIKSKIRLLVVEYVIKLLCQKSDRFVKKAI